MKRILSILLALTLSLTLMSLWTPEAQAATVVAHGTCSSDGKVNSDGLLTVAGNGNMDNYASVLYVPWVDYISQIKHLSIMPGVTNVGSRAFYGCSNLENIGIADTVTSIGFESFGYCTSLTTARLPASVTGMSNCAFEHCSAMTSFYVDEDNRAFSSDGKALMNKAQTRIIRLNAQATKQYTIPDTVTTIDAYAFSDCLNLTYLSIPEKVTSLGAPFMINCPAMARVHVNQYNPSFSVDGGSAVLSKDGSVLIRYCVDQNETYTFPYSVTAIGDYAFYGSENLKSITIPGNVTTLGVGAFEGCDNMESVTIPTSIQEIPQLCFGYCNGLYKVTIPYSVRTIGQNAFFGCCHMYAVQFKGVAPQIADNAFGGVEATVCYPKNNSSWTESVRVNYGGSLKWVNPVSLTEQPENNKLPVGETAVFAVRAVGSETICVAGHTVAGISYQWQYKTPGGSSWINSTMTGCQTAALKVPVTAARNGYQYRCIATDIFGNKVTSSAGTLTVKTKITSQPSSQTASVGATAKFKVSATGAGLKYQWQYRTSSSGTWKNSGAAGYNTATLSISAATARNGYQYCCLITDANGAKIYSGAATLTVKPKITTQPADRSGYVGGTAKFTVKAAGDGLTYRWQYYTGSGWKNSSLTGYDTATLSVAITAPRNGQQYRCVVTDRNGNKAISDTASLIVKPRITAQPTDKTAASGATVKFTVKADGAAITYRWQYRTSAAGSWKNSGATGHDTATLTITAAASRNGYQYRCVIEDENGSKVISSPATLTVK